MAVVIWVVAYRALFYRVISHDVIVLIELCRRVRLEFDSIIIVVFEKVEFHGYV